MREKSPQYFNMKFGTIGPTYPPAKELLERPKANEEDVLLEEKYQDEIEILPVETIKDVLEIAFKGQDVKEEFNFNKK